MIFGFNTDVPGKGAVYHVQTEDRGAKNPIVESIVYVGGKIVDRRRTSYVPEQLTQAAIEEMVRKQHKDLVESIRSGEFAPAAAAASPAAAPPQGYSVELRNAADVFNGERLRFEISVCDRQQVPAKGVSLEVRWLLDGTKPEEHSVAAMADGRAVLSFDAPAAPAEAFLLIRAEGPAGREFAKFRVRQNVA